MGVSVCEVVAVYQVEAHLGRHKLQTQVRHKSGGDGGQKASRQLRKGLKDSEEGLERERLTDKDRRNSGRMRASDWNVSVACWVHDMDLSFCQAVSESHTY